MLIFSMSELMDTLGLSLTELMQEMYVSPKTIGSMFICVLGLLPLTIPMGSNSHEPISH